MVLPQDGLFAIVTVLILALPTFILWKAYARSRSIRVLLASLGFTAFILTDFTVFLDQAGFAPLAGATEVTEFLGDLVTAGCFAAAFLIPVRGEP